MGSTSATPIGKMEERLKVAHEALGLDLAFFKGDLLNYEQTTKVIQATRPEAIVHLAEQPSAPFSMIDRDHAVYTQENNVIGTLNLLFAMRDHAKDSHLVKLGTMGEYGTPNLDIPEGFFEVDYRGRKDYLPFPRQAGSFYHWSKVHDSGNVSFACKIWGLRSTDIMQGVVYGTRTPEFVNDRLLTRFDFDEAFGTAINRYCAQAVIGFPLTPYGKGTQKRGFIALIDSIQCMRIALENPPREGQYRVFNQLDEVYDVYGLAMAVKEAAIRVGLDAKIEPIDNPRVEKEDHHYQVDRSNLQELGFKPTRSLQAELDIMLSDLLRFRRRIYSKREHITPTISWRHGRVGETPRYPSKTSQVTIRRRNSSPDQREISAEMPH